MSEPLCSAAVAATLVRRLDTRPRVFRDSAVLLSGEARWAPLSDAVESDANRAAAVVALWCQGNAGMLAPVEWDAAGVPRALRRAVDIADASRKSASASSVLGRGTVDRRGRRASGQHSAGGVTEWAECASRLWSLCSDGVVFPAFHSSRMLHADGAGSLPHFPLGVL